MGITDCSRCVALCCVALSFDRGEHFVFDKAAGTPCPHLGADYRCGIHHERAARGFGGCVRYDCHGAGPAAVASIGRSWRGDPAAAAALFEAFQVARDVGEARELLETARKLRLPPDVEARLEDLVSKLGPATWPEMAAPVREFLRTLRPLFARAGAGNPEFTLDLIVES